MSVNLTISLKHLNAVISVLNRHIYECEECIKESCEFIWGENEDEIAKLPNRYIDEDGQIEDEDVSNFIEALETANIGQGDKYIDILYSRDFINQVECSNLLKKFSEEKKEEEVEEEDEEEEDEEEEEEEEELTKDTIETLRKELEALREEVSTLRDTRTKDEDPGCDKCGCGPTSVIKFGRTYHRSCDDCANYFEGDAIAFDKYPTDTRSKRHIKNTHS